MPRSDSKDFHPLPGDRGATLSQLFNAIVNTVKVGLRVRMPATVVSYQAPVVGKSPALVTVLPDFKSVRVIDNPAELRAGETLLTQTDTLLAVSTIGPIPNCPVVFEGPAGMRSSGPLEPGEGGLYIVMDRCMDQWINTGGPLDPAYNQFHDISDGVFIPGLRHGLNTGLVPDDAHRVGREDGTAGMSINRLTKDIAVTTDGPAATIDAASTISLGALATLGVARITDKTSADTSMAIFITNVIAAAASGAPTVIPPPTDFGTISTASTKVKSE